MSTESESKFVVCNFHDVEQKLALQGKQVLPWHFEHNTVFDTIEGSLRAQNILLRLRIARTNSLTLKKPLTQTTQPSLRVKHMEELETKIKDASLMEQILHGLGYQNILYYEKFRSQWETKGGIVCLDHLPFGKFVEIEGTESIIADVARNLGLNPALASAETYHQLYQKHLVAAHLPPSDSFCFSKNEQKTVSKVLGLTEAK